VAAARVKSQLIDQVRNASRMIEHEHSRCELLFK
jgi:hypothetical protein